MDAEMHDVDMKQERINNEDQPGASQGDRLGGHVKEEDDGRADERGGDKSDSEGEAEEKGQKKDSVVPVLGNAVWAKVRGYPTWPGLLISADDGRDGVPPQPKPAAVLVHFFGTYDITWVESVKKVHDYDANYDLYCNKTKQKNFLSAMDEAKAYIQTGELPKRMTGDFDPNEDSGKPRKVGRKFKKGGEADLFADNTGAPRRTRIARFLGLLPPIGGGVVGSPIRVSLASAALTPVPAA